MPRSSSVLVKRSSRLDGFILLGYGEVVRQNHDNINSSSSSDNNSIHDGDGDEGEDDDNNNSRVSLLLWWTPGENVNEGIVLDGCC